MPDYSANNKRLVKNTLLLYIRMLFTMTISLYTSRIVLNALGVEDYGIYNLVGGVVALFSAASTTLNVAINRFITYELGKGDQEKLRRVFSTSLNIQIIVIFILFIIAETLGVWYLNNKMVIPEERIVAANWCLQFSVISFSVSLINVPYNSSIIAHEKMSAFACISILEAIGKLLIAWGIMITPYDRLITYSCLMTGFIVIIWSVYAGYCKRQFEECSYHFFLDIGLAKQMFGFVGWAFIGVSSWALQKYGFVILINLFFGPLVNAAYAIATQVETAVTGFANNFMMALNPQITKAYAANNKEYMYTLVFQGARFSSYIMLFLAMPVILNTHYILELWLKQVPEHTVLFVQLILLLSMLSCLSGTLNTTQIATGEIKYYQLVVSPINLVNVPVAYLFYYWGYMPETILVVCFIINHVALIASLLMLHRMVGINIWQYIREVYINVVIVSFLAFIVPLLLSSNLDRTFPSFVISTIISFCSTSLVVLYIGCKSYEREFLYTKLNTIKVKYFKIFK